MQFFANVICRTQCKWLILLCPALLDSPVGKAQICRFCKAYGSVFLRCILAFCMLKRNSIDLLRRFVIMLCMT